MAGAGFGAGGLSAGANGMGGAGFGAMGGAANAGFGAGFGAAVTRPNIDPSVGFAGSAASRADAVLGSRTDRPADTSSSTKPARGFAANAAGSVVAGGAATTQGAVGNMPSTAGSLAGTAQGTGSAATDFGRTSASLNGGAGAAGQAALGRQPAADDTKQ
jgi:hypothetical protein